jgi:H+/Cl- antiporter ClcA
MQSFFEDGTIHAFRGSVLKFGAIQVNDQQYSPSVLIGSIIIGIVGGCMGGFFIAVNFRVNAFRKKILVYEWMKPLETALMCFISSSVFYWIPYLMTTSNLDQACVPNSHQKLPPA